jgi:hypothetical protein
MKCQIPGTAREIVEQLIDQDYTVKQLAKLLGVTSNTVYRIRRGRGLKPQIHLSLIQLYLSIQQQITGQE